MDTQHPVSFILFIVKCVQFMCISDYVHETKLERKHGFRRPNGRFVFGESACIAPVTGSSVVIGVIVSKLYTVYTTCGTRRPEYCGIVVKGTAPT